MINNLFTIRSWKILLKAAFSNWHYPKFKHDCQSCIFIRTVNLLDSEYIHRITNIKKFDAYYCPTSLSIVARFGNKPEQYYSSQIRYIDSIKGGVKDIDNEFDLLLKYAYSNMIFKLRHYVYF